jgi:hypothetical protein
MARRPPAAREVVAWCDEHEEIAGPHGVRVFCFLSGNPSETFWAYLGSVLGDLGPRSCTSTAIERRRAPEWIRQCALEDMDRERNTRRRERYEWIASFCRRRGYELAPGFESSPRVRPAR